MLRYFPAVFSFLALLGSVSFGSIEIAAAQRPPQEPKKISRQSALPEVIPSNSDNGGHGIGNGEFNGGISNSNFLDQLLKGTYLHKNKFDQDRPYIGPRGGHGLGNTGSKDPFAKISRGYIICLDHYEVYLSCKCEQHGRLSNKPIILSEQIHSDYWACEDACENAGLGEAIDSERVEGSYNQSCNISENSIRFDDLKCAKGTTAFGTVTIQSETSPDLQELRELEMGYSRACCRASAIRRCRPNL